MENMNTVIDAKIGNLNELTKVLSIKGQAQEQLIFDMQALGIGKIVRNLKFEKIQGYTLTSLFITLLIMRLWGKTSLPCPPPGASVNTDKNDTCAIVPSIHPVS